MLPRMVDTPVIVTPRPVPREPEMISDGGGLPFTPAAVVAEFAALDPHEPSAQALIEQIDRGRRQANKRGLFRRGAPLAPLDDSEKLAGWRALAISADEVLYAKGRPPQLLTVAVKSDRKDRWTVVGVSNSRPLRVTRDGVRASSWRLDPEFEVSPTDTELHVLVTELTMASGTRAADRILQPDLHLDQDELLLRLYVKPLEGYTGRSRLYETPVVVKLPEPVGSREIVDGALYQAD